MSLKCCANVHAMCPTHIPGSSDVPAYADEAGQSAHTQ